MAGICIESGDDKVSRSLIQIVINFVALSGCSHYGEFFVRVGGVVNVYSDLGKAFPARCATHTRGLEDCDIGIAPSG